MRFEPFHHRAVHRQTGLALLTLVVLILAGATALAMSLQQRKPGEFDRQLRDTRLLLEAKRLLLGGLYVENEHPGELRPADDNGTGDAFGGGEAGHIPWRQLHATWPMHRGDIDAERESIWYFVADTFRDGVSDDPLNYESENGLELDGVPGWAAILIAPGEPLSAGQAESRPSSAITDIDAYLEDDNADGDDQYVSNSAQPFNDLVLGIHREEVLELAASFAARKFVSRLRKYRKNGSEGCGAYPAPAAYDASIAGSSDASFTSLVSDPAFITVGMPPVADEGVLPEDWRKTDDSEGCDEGLNQGVDSFLKQKWFRFMRYARAPNGNHGVDCSPGVDCLEVRDASGNIIFDDVEALVVMSGLKLVGQDWSGSPSVEDFFEDDNADSDRFFVRAKKSGTFNDLIFVVSRSGS